MELVGHGWGCPLRVNSSFTVLLHHLVLASSEFCCLVLFGVVGICGVVCLRPLDSDLSQVISTNCFEFGISICCIWTLSYSMDLKKGFLTQSSTSTKDKELHSNTYDSMWMAFLLEL